MIAIPHACQSFDDLLLTQEARRRLGGRAYVMSEYATRLAEAVTELIETAATYRDKDHPLADGGLDRVIELDGRIEALRLRLGIEAIPAIEQTVAQRYAGRYQERKTTEIIGYTRLGIFRGHIGNSNWDWDSDSEVAGTTYVIYINADDDWKFRMNSLKEMAKELAIAPELDPEELEIVKLLTSVGRRLTTTQILSEFDQRGIVKAESTVKGKLAQLTRRKVLVNRADTNPKGYGLPEWA